VAFRLLSACLEFTHHFNGRKIREGVFWFRNLFSNYFHLKTHQNHHENLYNSLTNPKTPQNNKKKNENQPNKKKIEIVPDLPFQSCLEKKNTIIKLS